MESNLWKPRVLVIGPGGIKALKILGFLSPLEDYKLLDLIDTYCGVSIGAVICLLTIVGYSIREIVGGAIALDIFKEMEDFDFHSGNKGLISNEPARKQLSKLVIDKLGNVPNLHNLYMMTGKSFISVTLNTTDDKCEMLSPSTHPTLSCVDAVIFSINIPFLFYQLIYQNKIYVDGVLGNPYPINYFDDGNTNILGIYVKNKENPIIQKISPGEKIIPINTYFLRIYDCLIDQRRNNIIQKSSNKCKHVCLFCKSVNSSRVEIEDKSLMLVEGYNEGREFLIDLKNNISQDHIKEDFYEYPPYYINGET